MEEEDFTLDVIGDIYTSHAKKRLKERGYKGVKIRAPDRENVIVTVLPPPIKKKIYKKKTTTEEIRKFYEINNTMTFCNGECKRKIHHRNFNLKSLSLKDPICINCIRNIVKEHHNQEGYMLKCNGSCNTEHYFDKFDYKELSNNQPKCRKCSVSEIAIKKDKIAINNSKELKPKQVKKVERDKRLMKKQTKNRKKKNKVPLFKVSHSYSI